MPPVGFQLGFTGAPGADAAAQPGQRRALARKPGQQVPQLGKFHLQLALFAAGPLGEDIQDQRGAVNHPYTTGLFQVADLGGGQLPVKHQQVNVLLPTGLCHLLHHARTDAGGRIRGRAFLHHGEGGLRSGGAAKLFQLV